MNKRVIIPEGMENEVSKKMYKLLYKTVKAAENYIQNQDGDRKRIMLKWISESKTFLVNPLIEMEELK